MIKNKIQFMIAELLSGIIHTSDYHFAFSSLWSSKSFTKLITRYCEGRALCSTFRMLLLMESLENELE